VKLLDQIVAEIEDAGSDHLPTFGGRYEGGYAIQQHPEELARLVCLLNAYGPFVSSLEIGIASGGTTRFLREQVAILQSAVIDDGRHHRFTEWLANRAAIDHPVVEFIGDSHSLEAAAWLAVLDRRFDLVGIDGDHSAEGVRADWELVLPYLQPGAVVWFHDVFCAHCPGVVDHWQQLRRQYPVLLETNVLGIGVLASHF
jgi:predicted O-methyltransferase YrrM